MGAKLEKILQICKYLINFAQNFYLFFLKNNIYMILDKLENADLYYESVPGLAQFMKFFNDNDLEEMPACKIYLDGTDLYVNITDFEGKPADKCYLEAHRDYLDIQVPMNSDEIMGWKAQVDCQKVRQEYDEGKDIEFYQDKPLTQFVVPAGYFVVFFPSDAHQPGIAPGKKYRKLIVKSRVNQ